LSKRPGKILAKINVDIFRQRDHRVTVSSVFLHINPDCAVASYCDLKILAATLVSRFLPASGRLLLDIFINMPMSQNRSNCAFRYGFLSLATDSEFNESIVSGETG
jgi:hypothetical protein